MGNHIAMRYTPTDFAIFAAFYNVVSILIGFCVRFNFILDFDTLFNSWFYYSSKEEKRKRNSIKFQFYYIDYEINKKVKNNFPNI